MKKASTAKKLPAARKAKSRASALPEWDLSDLYKAPDSPAVEKDFAQLDKSCEDFRRLYEGKVDQLKAYELARAIHQYENIQELFGKLGSYAQLRFAKNMSDPATAQFYQNTQEKITVLSSRILFFALAINKLEEKHLQDMMKDADLRHYAPWLRDIRAF